MIEPKINYCNNVLHNLIDAPEHYEASRQEKYKRVSFLAWQILELKFAYYYPVDIHDDFKETHIKPDSWYDSLEDEYKKLCKELKINPTASDMVGFKEEKPSCRLVKIKLTNPKDYNYEKMFKR